MRAARSIGRELRSPRVWGGMLALVLGGCVTRTDLLEQERRLSVAIQEQARSVAAMRQDLEALREHMSGRRPGTPLPPPPPSAPRSKAPPKPPKEKLTQPSTVPSPSDTVGMTLSPEGTSAEDPTATSGTIAALEASPVPPPTPAPAAAPPPGETAPAPAVSAPAAAPAPTASPSPVDDEWKREVAQERAVASATGTAARGEYLGALEGLEQGDCAKALGRLKAVSAGGGSPLSDNAVYWQGKCLAARGDQRKAASKLDEVVKRYPKSDKAPAALWAQGQMHLRAGDTAAARTALGKLIRDYPASAEAAKARTKLAQMGN